jgi:fucose 4-O-acetylase-like acetyltransferase
MRGTGARLAAATTTKRDRYVDFLRAFSISVVVLGHWLMATVSWPSGGGVHAGNALATMRWLQPATWVLQVMPVFFFVGGFAHLVTYDANRRRGGRYAQFVHGRCARLLRPVTVLLAVWVPLTLVLDRTLPAGVVRPVTKLVVQLLWFLGVYVIVVALAPLTIRLHRRHGVGVLVAYVGLAALIDLAVFGLGWSALGYVNVLPVWLFAHQLGYCYADGSFDRWGRRVPLALASGGLAALVGLTAWGPYPTSMVGMPGERVSNMSPPTICIVALTCWLVGLVMLARPYVTRWLARPRVWTGVVAMNGVIMTVFLWHLTALLVAVLVLLPLGFPQPAVGTAFWWALRPVWFAVLVSLLAGLVAVFGRLERPRAVTYVPVAGRTPVLRQACAVAGVTLVAAGVLGLAVAGLSSPATSSARIVVLAVTPLSALAYLGLGAWLLRRTAPRSA